MEVLHNIVMKDKEYRWWQAFLARLERDSVFATDAGKAKEIFARSVTVKGERE